MHANKTLFLFFLVLYFIAGLSLLITGSVAHHHASQFTALTGPAVVSGAGFIISLGVIILILSVLGFLGAYKNRLGLLKIFIGSLLLILLLQFIAVIVGFTLRSKADNQLRAKLISSLPKYTAKVKEVVVEWDRLQEKWSCCGVNNSSDWDITADLAEPPDSCCLKADCTSVAENGSAVFEQGCYLAARNIFFRYSKALGGVSLFFLLVEIAGTILAIGLLRDLKNNYGSV
ncbi:unnamed protein product [Rotaria socialis]|uniref:Tetraspanin n=1 Tax=Rotaria socialis TaxID=392032 RepID=A0A818M564_9BILA|nr:unnamed protein product [Rotaria socialis]CAF3415097.1 unnamed protein product [Rotaria socialis]CAF3454420.1 unnamed protein product [Rotaria socialis]CAF3573272.1 unnamed protein product [Rotaria socialis]CAF3585241.1 unnamed protein product [Rotaria socialis]